MDYLYHIRFYLLFIMSLFFGAGQAFAQEKEQRFPAQLLKEDLSTLKRQIYNAHADPFTELNHGKFDELFDKMGLEIKDSLTRSDFYRIARPAIAYLGDEHAEISLPEGFSLNDWFLPLTIMKKNERYFVETCLTADPEIKPEMEITAIDGQPVAALLQTLKQYTSGFEDERMEKAMKQFGYLYTLASDKKSNFTITGTHQTLQLNAVSLEVWTDHLKKLNGFANYKERISYQNHGGIGYITAASFGVRGNADFERYRLVIDSIFRLVEKDAVKKLVIDVSENSGGNSGIGNLIIDKFYKKPYRSYQANWRRSDEYLQVMKSHGDPDADYEKLLPGAILHYDPEIIKPADIKNKYNGKVFILVGDGTFSSAIMFATTIKDNAMATLIGKSPKNGHPTHFGELYSFALPNAQLTVRFGVKEWIRPAGRKVKNTLVPDIEVDPKNIQEVLKVVANVK